MMNITIIWYKLTVQFSITLSYPHFQLFVFFCKQVTETESLWFWSISTFLLLKTYLYIYLRSERSSFGLLSSFNASEKASLAALKSSRWNSAILRINNSNKLGDHNIIIFIYLNFLCVLVIMRIKNVNLKNS